MGWLASLTLEDEGRKDLGLTRVVCEYDDILLDELLGLPPHKDVDFAIELHPGTSPISMTPHRMTSVELHELSNCRNCWTRVLLDRILHHGALRFFLLRRRIRLFDYSLTTDC